MPKKKRSKHGPKKQMKLSDDVVKKLEEAFALDCSIEEACYYADISRQTLYNWKKAHPDLFDKFERLRQKPVLKARKTVVNNLENPEIAFKYLERKRKNEFAPKSILTGTLVTGELTDEQKKRVDQILKTYNEDD